NRGDGDRGDAAHSSRLDGHAAESGRTLAALGEGAQPGSIETRARRKAHARVCGQRAEHERLYTLERQQRGRRHGRVYCADFGEQERRGQDDAGRAERDEQRPEAVHAAGVPKMAFSRTMRATPGRVSSAPKSAERSSEGRATASFSPARSVNRISRGPAATRQSRDFFRSTRTGCLPSRSRSTRASSAAANSARRAAASGAPSGSSTRYSSPRMMRESDSPPGRSASQETIRK